MTKRLTFAGWFWLSYVAVACGFLVSCVGAHAAINDSGWTQCATSPYALCSVTNAWVRRGQGDDYVTRWAPVASGTVCQPYEANEYGAKGFGSRAHSDGDTCWYKPAEGTVGPNPGLGFVAGVGYPGGYVSGYVTAVCISGSACTSVEGDTPPPDPGASSPTGSTPGALAMDQALTMLCAAVVLFFAFHGYSVGSRR